MKKFLFFLIVSFSLGCTAQPKQVYLFSYFMDNGEDGLHLAFSEDGFTWHPLNNNKSILKPQAGQDKLMRDPCIILGPDSKFHMVWTVSWNEKGIGYASSNDLINWSEQKFIPVMAHEPEARNCWAPELFYDEDSGGYMIFWATTIPKRFPETDASAESGYNHRIYYVRTNDFVDFSKTELLYDMGFNVIDATIQKINDNFVMFMKNETLLPHEEKNIRVATSDQLCGNYTAASEPITKNWVEGPTVIKTGKGWVVYFDRYTEGRMGAVISEDLQNWKDISDYVKFPEGTRHGTVLKVDESVVFNIMESVCDVEK